MNKKLDEIAFIIILLVATQIYSCSWQCNQSNNLKDINDSIVELNKTLKEVKK